MRLNRPVYLDCNATCPLHPAAREAMLPWLSGDGMVGNAGSRTHAYGAEAHKIVNHAREQIGAVVEVPPGNVVFTSGATEANNLAILGLARFGHRTGRRHVVTTSIEHKAVLEPVGELRRTGFEVTHVQPDLSGRVSAEQIIAATRENTLLVSLMHVNNETGLIQPVDEVAERLGEREVVFHVDAAQGFAKDLHRLRHKRIDLISVSGHKIGGPMGIGALIIRKRNYRAPDLSPQGFGGGQERGLRPGTLPVMLVAGMGAAAQAKLDGHAEWTASCLAFRDVLLEDLSKLPAAFELNMDLRCALPNCLNLSFRDRAGNWISSESVLLALKDVIAASNGSACTSAGIEPSHVLAAQQVPTARVRAAIRLSWCDSTPRPDWSSGGEAMQRLL